MIREVVDYRSRDDVDKKAQKSRVAVDQDEDRDIYEYIECYQYIGHAVVLAGLVRQLADDDVREDLGAVDAAAGSQDE